MSVSILEATEAHIRESGLLDGYSVIYFRFHDDAINKEGEPFVMLRSSGGGATDPVGGIGNPDIQIFVVGTATGIVDADDTAHSIRDYLIDNHRVQNVVNYESLTNVIGPIYLENDRPMYEINLRLTTTRVAS